MHYHFLSCGMHERIQDQKDAEKKSAAKAEQAGSPKRDFSDVMRMFEKARGTRDYWEMERDIIGLVSTDPDSEDWAAWQEVYPGWEREDFVRLLAELGTPLGGPTAQEVLRHKERELNALQAELAGKEDELKRVQDSVRWDAIFHSPEEMLESHRKSLARDRADLKTMGFFARHFTDRQRAKNLRANIVEDEESIRDREAFIASSPFAERQAREAEERAARAEKIERLQAEIAALGKRIETLRQSLK